MINIHELTWTDEYGEYAVCPECDGRAQLMLEDDDGRQEWHCEECWHAFDENGRYLRRVHKAGMGELKCPVCGDFRVAHDIHGGGYYCRKCKSAFHKAKTEACRDKDGWPSGRIVDFGPVESPETCPNCGDPLRAQFFETLQGDFWAYPCRTCQIVYLSDGNGKLAIPPECPKCCGLSLFVTSDIYTDRSVYPPQLVREKIQECRLCHTKFDMDGQYLNPEDMPTEGNRSVPKFAIGLISSNPKQQ